MKTLTFFILLFFASANACWAENTPQNYNLNGCKCTINVASSVCAYELIDVEVKLEDLAGPSQDDFEVSLSGGTGVAFHSKGSGITKVSQHCDETKTYKVWTGSTAGTVLIKIDHGTCGKFTVHEYKRPGSKTRSPEDGIEATDITFNGPVTTGPTKFSFKYESSSDDCDAEYTYEMKISYTGFVSATATTSIFDPFAYAEAGAAAFAQQDNNVILKQGVSTSAGLGGRSADISIGPISVPLNYDTDGNARESIDSNGYLREQNWQEHDPNETINRDANVTVGASVTGSYGGFSAQSSAGAHIEADISTPAASIITFRAKQ